MRHVAPAGSEVLPTREHGIVPGSDRLVTDFGAPLFCVGSAVRPRSECLFFLIHDVAVFSMIHDDSTFVRSLVRGYVIAFVLFCPLQGRARCPAAQPRQVQGVIPAAQAVGHGRALAEG